MYNLSTVEGLEDDPKHLGNWTFKPISTRHIELPCINSALNEVSHAEFLWQRSTGPFEGFSELFFPVRRKMISHLPQIQS